MKEQMEKILKDKNLRIFQDHTFDYEYPHNHHHCLLPVCLWFLLFTSQSRPWTEAWRSTWSGNGGRERALGHLAGLREKIY